MLKVYLAVMLGGSAGVAARHWMSAALAARYGETFPVGTLVVNVVGCFIIGVFAVLTGPDGIVLTSPLVRQTVMIGILGGFTTFSSFSLQTVNLLKDGEFFYALLNVGGSVVACLAATWLGMLAAAWFNAK